MLTAGRQLERALESVMPGATKICDYKEEGTVDSVLLIDKSLQVLRTGTTGLGYAAWMVVNTEIGHIGIIAIHAPTKKRLRPDVWTWIQGIMDAGQWILLGDLNMVENRNDSIGPSPVLRDREMWKWNMCSNKVDLVLAHSSTSKRRSRSALKSFFKMDARALANTETAEKVKHAWENHPTWVREDRRRWAMAWARVREVLLKRKNMDN
ncbi:hypothetical protein R1sor_021398 [Riccia sorocarpa]|uniref:Endonuclease/exonuclease/phosphatase domain-containing protein n=1 Tax=Riccia sorocarpa TaxID=122646 RepID=A0ABD3GJW3_9MARC